jgi:hypothetical protein
MLMLVLVLIFHFCVHHERHTVHYSIMAVISDHGIIQIYAGKNAFSFNVRIDPSFT